MVVRSGGHQALDELRRVIGVLRDELALAETLRRRRPLAAAAGIADLPAHAGIGEVARGVRTPVECSGARP